MTHGAQDHDHKHREHAHNQQGPWWKHVHRSWLFWTGLVLMVVAMVVYVLTQNESVGPGGKVNPQMPASP